MKKRLCFLYFLTILLIFTGCAEQERPGAEMDQYRISLSQEQEKTPIQVSQEDALAACGAVLRDLQSRESLCLYDQREYEGEGAFGGGSQILHWKSGEDWMEKNCALIWIPARGGIYEETMLTYVSRQGEYFYGVENGVLNEHSYTSVGWWGEELPQSWLLSCHWDTQQVQLRDAFRTETGKSYLLEFATPYQIMRKSYLQPVTTRDYTVEFYFDHGGNFEKAVMKGDYLDSSQGEVSITSIMSVVSTDAQEIAGRIDAEMKRPAIKSVFDTPDRNYLF